MVLSFAAPRAALLAATGHLVDRGPCPALRLAFGSTTLLVALFDMLGLSFLFASVCFFGTSRHLSLLVSYYGGPRCPLPLSTKGAYYNTSYKVMRRLVHL